MKFFFFAVILVVIVLQFPKMSAGQISPDTEANPAFTFIPYRQSNAFKPTFYELATPFTDSEIHIFESLSEQELSRIAAETDPPAIGIARNFKVPLSFDLKKIRIPERGAITVPGGRLVRDNDTMLIFTTLIKSPGACEVRLCIPEGYFPIGIQFNLFGKNNQAFCQDGLEGGISEYGFFTKTMFSDIVILQIVMPSSVFDKELYFKIPMIIHVDEDFNDRIHCRDCYEDVNCYEASLFPLTGDLKKSTARLVFFADPFYYVCSGNLLNDTRLQDFQPFMLTANHCISTQAVAATVEARFDYYTLSCNGAVNQEIILVNGSNLVATSSNTDFALLLLHQQPEGARTFLGWITTAIENDEVLHSVHHPAGSTQKYTRHQNKADPLNLCSGVPTDKYYYTRTQAGQASGGSSGASLIRSDGKVAGQLRSICLGTGYNPCNYDTYYHTWGRFEESCSDNNLQYWLSGGGSNVSIYISSAYLDFGEVQTGNRDTLNIIVSNNGLAAQQLNLELYAVNITGIHSSEFLFDPPGNLYLSPGASANFKIVFRPLYAGTKTAMFEIFHNADNVASPLFVNLSGVSTELATVLPLQNLHIFSGMSLCFEATQTIFLAGDDSYFIAENQSITELIAGHNIVLQAGTQVLSGADFLARITSNGSFCNLLSPEETNVKSGVILSTTTVTNTSHKTSFLLFPNPTTGRITITPADNVTMSALRMEICDMPGKTLINIELPPASQHHTDLSFLPPGIYILKIIRGTETGVEKLIRFQ